MQVPPPSSDGTSSAPDHDLLERLRQGDAQAFEALYDESYDRLWRFAYGFVRTRAVAQEIVHDVFLTLWANRATLDVRGAMQSYLYGAVRNLALKYVRHERVVERETGEVLEHYRVGDEQSAPNAHEVIERDELSVVMERLIAELPERHRTAITLRWRHGMRYEEVAKILGVSPQAARTLVLRVQTTLKGLIDRVL